MGRLPPSTECSPVACSQKQVPTFCSKETQVPNQQHFESLGNFIVLGKSSLKYSGASLFGFAYSMISILTVDHKASALMH